MKSLVNNLFDCATVTRVVGVVFPVHTARNGGMRPWTPRLMRSQGGSLS